MLCCVFLIRLLVNMYVMLCFFFQNTKNLSIVFLKLITIKRTSRACVYHPGNFCYICESSLQKFTKNLAKRLKVAYQFYFGIKLRDQEKLGPSNLLHNMLLWANKMATQKEKINAFLYIHGVA